MTPLHNTWRNQNKQVSGQLINSYKYWYKSPSNILLYSAIRQAMATYASNKSVLDAGAGRLAYRQLISTYAGSYTSSDFQKTHPELDEVMDIEKMTFKTASFETVFCSQVLEHVPHPWIALKEIYRVLKPNGIAIVTVPHLAYLHNLPYDFFRYTEGGLRSLSADTGFTVLTVKPLGGFFSFLGYIRSSVLMPLFWIPLLGEVVFGLNAGLSWLETKLDASLKTDKLFPLNYMLIAKKTVK